MVGSDEKHAEFFLSNMGHFFGYFAPEQDDVEALPVGEEALVPKPLPSSESCSSSPSADAAAAFSLSVTTPLISGSESSPE